MTGIKNKSGFTLVEIVMVIIIAGILATVAFRSGKNVYFTAKTEQTKQELDDLAFAITGNPTLNNEGVRSDFGYVGDVGDLPPDLDALVHNPGGLATWKGPYFQNRFSQINDDYKTDAWGKEYVYDLRTITSKGTTTGGSGCGGPVVSSDIVRRICTSTNELLVNRISGVVLDCTGTPPGHDYRNSVRVMLTIPDGSGSMTNKITTVNTSGYFGFDSIPIGNHNLNIIYLPDNDTLNRFVSITPSSSVYNEYRLDAAWSSGGLTGLTKVTGSDSLNNDCGGFYFLAQNNSGSAITISSVVLTWSSPTAYFRYIIWNSTTVFNRNNPKAASGELVTFSSPQTISNGQTLKIEFDYFRTFPTGGSGVDMDNTAFTIDFSDGSTLNVITGDCP